MQKNRNSFSRRDFLKLASLLPLAYFAQPLAKLADGQAADPDAPGVIVLVYDALSANHLSLYGYPLPTMPNLEKFAAKATVYHQHYSAGTFTIPGTASLLTGLHPWTHRAFSLGAAGVADQHAGQQVFSVFGDSHNTLGYSQNKYSDSFLYQFGRDLDRHVSSSAFDLDRRMFYNLPIFKNDGQVAFASLNDNIFEIGSGYDSSLFVGTTFRAGSLIWRKEDAQRYEKQYPRGLPDSTEQFLLSDVVDGAIGMLGSLRGPSVAYLHFHPPHHPYRPTAEYFESFKSLYVPTEKPLHPLASARYDYTDMRRNRQLYDEYVLSWDAELGRLYDFLQTSGLLDKNYVVVTSDHGELFERGDIGHFAPLIYDSLIHIPLLISRPGQTAREDVYAPTSSVDVLPSLAQAVRGSIPAWVEGELLPGLGGVENPDRSLYALDAKKNASYAPLTKFSASLTRNHYRLTRYEYPEFSQYEFYDLEADPEELSDLYPARPAQAVQMQDELLQKLDEANRPYKKK